MKRSAAVVVVLAMVTTGWLAAEGVSRLVDARSAYRRTSAAIVPARLRAALGTAIVAPDARSAQRRLADLLADRASLGGLRLEIAAAASGPTGFVIARIGGSGPEPAIRGFARANESGLPTIRFGRWSLRRQGGGLRFDAEAIAGWADGGIASGASTPIRIGPPRAPAALAGGPLFAGTDGPDEAEAGAAPPQLAGITGRIGVDPQAMLRLQDGSTRTVGPGQLFGGWRIVAIAKDRVRFSRDGRERVAVLPTATDPSPSGQ